MCAGYHSATPSLQGARASELWVTCPWQSWASHLHQLDSTDWPLGRKNEWCIYAASQCSWHTAHIQYCSCVPCLFSSFSYLSLGNQCELQKQIRSAFVHSGCCNKLPQTTELKSNIYFWAGSPRARWQQIWWLIRPAPWLTDSQLSSLSVCPHMVERVKKLWVSFNRAWMPFMRAKSSDLLTSQSPTSKHHCIVDLVAAWFLGGHEHSVHSQYGLYQVTSQKLKAQAKINCH